MFIVPESLFGKSCMSQGCNFLNKGLQHIYFLTFFFSFYLGFLSRTFTIHRQQGQGEAISLSPLYHFHPLHRHLDISRAINAGSSPLHIASSRTRTGKALVSERKSLTTKLRALTNFMKFL